MEPDPDKQENNEMESSPAGAEVTAPSPTAKTSSMTMAKSPDEKDHPVLPGHDSMVTVRLSEPPNLSVNTNLPPGIPSSRRSIFGPEFIPTPTSTTISRQQEAEVEDDASPRTAVHGSKNLSEELQDSAEEDENTEEILRNEPRESLDESEDEVNWDKLQKSEDEHARDDDNVG
jgi:hypothetical protein